MPEINASRHVNSCLRTFCRKQRFVECSLCTNDACGNLDTCPLTTPPKMSLQMVWVCDPPSLTSPNICTSPDVVAVLSAPLPSSQAPAPCSSPSMRREGLGTTSMGTAVVENSRALRR